MKSFKEFLTPKVEKETPIKQRKHFALDPVSDIRERFNSGEVFNCGDVVVKGGEILQVVERKTNYVVCEDINGEISKNWLKDLTPINEASVRDFLIWEPMGELQQIADGIDKLKSRKNELYRGISKGELNVLKKLGRVTSKGAGNTSDVNASYVADSIHLAGRFALVNYRDHKNGYILVLNKNKLPNVEPRDPGNFITDYIADDAVVKIIDLKKFVKKGVNIKKGVKESTELEEKLDVESDVKDWIDDFLKSDAPQFKGKTKQEKIDMALAAYYSARREAGLEEATVSNNYGATLTPEKFVSLYGKDLPQTNNNLTMRAKIQSLGFNRVPREFADKVIAIVSKSQKESTGLEEETSKKFEIIAKFRELGYRISAKPASGMEDEFWNEMGDEYKKLLDQYKRLNKLAKLRIGSKKSLENLHSKIPEPGYGIVRIREEKEDDLQGPDRYYSKDAEGDEMAKSTKKKRSAFFKKQSKKDDDDPSAYEPAPGDKSAKTKPSKHTKRFKQVFGESSENLEESNPKKAVQNKAEKTGISFDILWKVYKRGVAAWKTGHRPGTTPEQWGLARLNSFVTGGKTQKTTDADLWKMVKESAETDGFVPPAGAASAAKKALKWRDEHGDEVKAMTRVGWARANQLAKREKLSLDVVRRMAAFARHKKNSEINPKYKDTPWKDKGYVAWLGWGGDAGIEWAKRISKQQED